MFLPSSECTPYPFSNDFWTKEVVGTLKQSIPPRQLGLRRAGLVLGSASLPYATAHFGVDEVHVADRHGSVIAGSIARLDLMDDHERWRDYRDAVKDTLNPKDHVQYQIEWDATAALRVKYVRARAAVDRTSFYALEGDIQETASELGARLAEAGTVVSFVNLSNVAQYVNGNNDIRLGQQQLRKTVLDVLPMEPTAVIIDSGELCIAAIHSLTSYGR